MTENAGRRTKTPNESGDAVEFKNDPADEWDVSHGIWVIDDFVRLGYKVSQVIIYRKYSLPNL